MTRALSADAKGRRAEAIARLYFVLCGYQIVASRFKTPVGEIDMIVRNWLPWRAPVIAFVEVKRRSSMEEAAQSILGRQQQRIAQAADWYLQRHAPSPKYALRYDAIFIVNGLWPHHVPNAWGY